MAGELTITQSFVYDDGEASPIDISKSGMTVNVGTKKFSHQRQAIGTSEEALILGEVTTLGWAVFQNLGQYDVEIRVGTGSTRIILLKPGHPPASFEFGSGVTAPYAIATTGASDIEYVIVNQ